jgi:NSS family neurotransmitter:Na+ symporter
MSTDRGQWGSKFGFIMAAAGSAVGLGNIWRFPYLTGENGGAAFVLVYILCVVLVAVPMLINEIAIGRLTGKNPVGAVQNLGGNKLWVGLVGVLPLIVTFVVLSYYSTIAGWTVGYIFTSLFSIKISFAEFISNPFYLIPLGAAVILITAYIVLAGVAGGIEKVTKVLMPMLFILLIIVIIRSITLPGAGKGIEYYLIPDFSKITSKVILAALTQAFFSLGVGWGMMITYGSYLNKNQNIVSSSLWVGAMDTSIAFLAGFMIFPAVFAFNQSPDQGATLVFNVLANIFQQMPFVLCRHHVNHFNVRSTFSLFHGSEKMESQKSRMDRGYSSIFARHSLCFIHWCSRKPICFAGRFSRCSQNRCNGYFRLPVWQSLYDAGCIIHVLIYRLVYQNRNPCG